MYKVISTFSGCGGSSEGYKLAGLNVLGSVEFIDFQAQNYRLNHPNTRLYEEDIRKLDPKKIMLDLGLKEGELDIFDGSPPCSSFSISGKQDKLWGKVKKYSNRAQRTDDLFEEYIRFISIIKPKIFIAENVAGLTMGTSKSYLKFISKELSNLGYKVKAKILNAANYKVPQIRTRLFIVGVRNDINIEYNYPTPKKGVITLKEAFRDIKNTKEDLEEVNIERFAVYNRLVKLKYGESDTKRFNLLKLDPNKPSNTITAGAGNLGAASICHWDNRKLTVKEAKTIQTFSLDYKLLGNYQQQIEGIGRSVPPLLMKEVALEAKKVLDKYYEIH
jgi:DNA (cytosine-5)-methyltransferase 1